MIITALDHIQIAMPVNEEAAARHFYSDLLGFTEIPKPAPLQARGGCWFKGTSMQLHLGVEQPFQPARKAHPAFRVSDLEALRRRLEQANIPITPDNTLPDVQRFFTADPFGNRIEFIQQP